MTSSHGKGKLVHGSLSIIHLSVATKKISHLNPHSSTCLCGEPPLLLIVLASIFFILNSSSHFSSTPVLWPPALHLSLTALCPLFLRLVCHVITSGTRHISGVLFALLQNFCHCFFFFPVFLAFVQIPHTRQPGTERHSAY